MRDVYVRRLIHTWSGYDGNRISASAWLFKIVTVPAEIIHPGLIIDDGGDVILMVEDVTWSIDRQRVELTLSADEVSFRIADPTVDDLKGVIEKRQAELIAEGWQIEVAR